MGHSITDFRGVGFTAKDWKVATWLHLLAWEVDQIADRPAWLASLGDCWREQAALSVNGCINTNLDEILISQERVVIVRKLAQIVFTTLERFGEQVPCDFLNVRCGLPPEFQFRQDMQAESFLPYGRVLMKLLDGKLTGHECV